MPVEPETRRELARQVFHMLVGVGALAVLLLFGRGVAMAAVFFTLIIGTLLINARLLGMTLPLIRWFEERFERRDAPLPGWGSACYAAGALLALTFLNDTNQMAATILVLGVGDGLSTIVGLKGSMRLPYNRKKTLEGSAAMFISSLGAYYFVGPAAVPLAVIAAVAESLPRIDDNLSIPIACVLFFVALGG
jgi:dolichol kinase